MAGYFPGNRLFADRPGLMLKPDDVIRVDDDHLIPLAVDFRRRGCGTGSALSCISHGRPSIS